MLCMRILVRMKILRTNVWPQSEPFTCLDSYRAAILHGKSWAVSGAVLCISSGVQNGSCSKYRPGSRCINVCKLCRSPRHHRQSIWLTMVVHIPRLTTDLSLVMSQTSPSKMAISSGQTITRHDLRHPAHAAEGVFSHDAPEIERLYKFICRTASEQRQACSLR